MTARVISSPMLNSRRRLRFFSEDDSKCCSQVGSNKRQKSS